MGLPCKYKNNCYGEKIFDESMMDLICFTSFFGINIKVLMSGWSQVFTVWLFRNHWLKSSCNDMPINIFTETNQVFLIK